MPKFLYKGPEDFKDMINKAYSKLEFESRKNPKIFVKDYHDSFDEPILNENDEPMCGSKSKYDIPNDLIIFDHNYLVQVAAEDISSENFKNDFIYESARREMGTTKLIRDFRKHYNAWVNAEKGMLEAMDENNSDKLNQYMDEAVKHSTKTDFLGSFMNMSGITSVIDGLAFALSGEENPIFVASYDSYPDVNEQKFAVDNGLIFLEAFENFLNKNKPEDAINVTKKIIDKSYKTKKSVMDIALDEGIFGDFLINTD